MNIKSHALLKDYATMRLGGPAKALYTVTSKDELVQAVSWAAERQLQLLVLGGGSNVIFTDGWDGLVIINRIPGFEVRQTQDGADIFIGAGENWDKTVQRTVDMGLHGIEALSAIPGTTGATPVQNVGAYGAEIADTLMHVEAYDLHTQKFVILQKADCGFSYRHSIFKSPLERRYIISGIMLHLTHQAPQPPFYAGVAAYFDAHHISQPTVQDVRTAVMNIRAKKLPDPSIVANTGSFFKNPIVPAAEAAPLLAEYPAVPHWPMPGGKIKFAAGWLIENAGLRGYARHGFRTYEHHALVVINDSAQHYSDLAKFKQEIIATVRKKFGLTLEQEPELL